jgi:hypothetical protein
MEYKIREAETSRHPPTDAFDSGPCRIRKSSLSIPDGKAERLADALFLSKRLHGLVVEQGSELIGYATYTFDYSTWDAAEFMYLDCLFLKKKQGGKK